ncbi:MAG: SigE family RNA polymerase sigma factor [Actinomycetota bacterium]|nr:SigE family RNA polymerase sigma factor [Actinomycetota bacterium]
MATTQSQTTPGAPIPAFEDFAIANSASLLRVAYLLLGDRHSAEDAVQTTLMRTFRHWRDARANPKAYSWAVLINICRDRWRSAQRQRETLTAPGCIEDRPSAPALSSPIDYLVLHDALGRLPDQQRAVLVLRYYLDLSVPDTATALGIPEGTVKSATSRALDRLRQYLSFSNREELLC